MRCVVVFHEGGELYVGWGYGIAHGSQAGARRRLRSASEIASGIVKGMNEGTLFWRCGRDSVGLCHHFFEKDLRRHSSRGHAFAHLLDGLVETAGKQFSRVM